MSGRRVWGAVAAGALGALAATAVLSGCTSAKVATGPKVWVSARDGSQVVVIDPATNAETKRISVPGSPEGMALAPDAVWVSNVEGTKVWRIDKAKDEISAEVAVSGASQSGSASSSASAKPSASASTTTGSREVAALAYADGKVYLVSPVSGMMTVIDAAQAQSVAQVPVGPGASGVVVQGADVWITHRDQGVVTRNKIDTGAQLVSLPVGGQPLGMVLDSGSLWVMNAGIKQVAKISTATNTVAATVPTRSATAFGVMHGGMLWMTADDSLIKIDPSTAVAGDETRFGGINFGIASAGSTTVWVTDPIRNVVYRINPSRGFVQAKIGAGKGPVQVVTDATDDAGAKTPATPSGTVPVPSTGKA